MNKRLYVLINVLLPEETNKCIASPQNNELYESCYSFIQKELTLMAYFYRLPVYVLMQLFFVYCFLCSGFRFFKRLSKETQQKLIIDWENLWRPGHMLFRLLRGLIYLRYFDKT